MLTEAILIFLLTFFRFSFITIFAFSFLSKAKQPMVFVHSITRFNILKPPLIHLSAWCILIIECVIALLLLFNYLLVGFIVAFILLTILSIVIMIVLSKDIIVPCNCFGDQTTPVSIWTLGRNGGFMVGTVLGIWITTNIGVSTTSLNLVETAIIAPISFVAVMLITNLQTIKNILHL